MKPLSIFIENQTFVLHPSGAVFWEAEQMLLIADVHLGKASHFRKHGSPVPMDTILQNFETLNTVTAFFKPRQICFLRDLFHSYLNNEWHYFESWIHHTTAQVTLVTGNHDIIPISKYKAIGVHVVDFINKNSINLTHHPEEKVGFFTISGHIHPAVRLKGAGRQQVTLPCFFKQKKQLIVPAFGSFTGNFIIAPQQGDSVYGIADDEVIALALA